MSNDIAIIQEKLAGIGVGTIVLALQKLGVFRAYLQDVRPMTTKSAFAGRARTLQAMPLREDLMQDAEWSVRSRSNHRDAVEEIDEGEVLVTAARGSERAAVAGDLLIERARARGASAIVTDGCVRDTVNFVDGDLPVFARSVTMQTFRLEHIAFALNVPVACGEVLIMPGDILVGDRDGVVVIPQLLLDQVIETSLDQEHLDAFLRERIIAGASLNELAPPSEAILAEYRLVRGML